MDSKKAAKGARRKSAKKSAKKKGVARKAAVGKGSARKQAATKTAARARASRGGSASRRGRARRSLVGTLRWLGRISAVGAFVGGLWLSSWVLKLDRQVVARFEGRTFSVPSKVYAAPTVVYPGMDWQQIDLRGWLARLGYREQPEAGALEPGRFVWLPGELHVHLRAFEHPLRPEPNRDLIFHLGEGIIQQVVDRRSHAPVDVVVLEPEPVSAFLGSNREQRDLIRLDELPRDLINAVYSVEDRRFEHAVFCDCL